MLEENPLSRLDPSVVGDDNVELCCIVGARVFAGVLVDVRIRSVVQRTVTKEVLRIVVSITTVETGKVIAAVVVMVISVGDVAGTTLSPVAMTEVLLSSKPCSSSAVKDDQIAPSDGIESE